MTSCHPAQAWQSSALPRGVASVHLVLRASCREGLLRRWPRTAILGSPLGPDGAVLRLALRETGYWHGVIASLESCCGHPAAKGCFADGPGMTSCHPAQTWQSSALPRARRDQSSPP